MNINDVASIKIGLASPEAILGWSHGEVKKPETINYRSQKPERDGLFCERIFGPVRDWECSCGKYKKVKYKGVVCDRCGVEITRSDVRRERMGHIQLASPVTHIWYLKGIPSRIALLLGVSPKELENVVYFVKWIVIDPKDTPLSRLQILSIREKMEASARYGDNAFVAQTGAEAIKTLLEQTDIEQLYNSVHKELLDAQANSKGGRDKDLSDKCKKLVQRLETIKAFKDSGQKPEWMVLTVLPVIPPDLRPMLELDGGRFATNDLNDLYRRIITRNNRLNKLLELGTPELIVRNEKRMLQEAVDALIDNGRRNKPVLGTGNRPLKSLSSSLKGKQGRFRQNLLGKRVDYSGRSVIAVGPDLKMYQCGIPREMALQLFKPFIINECVHEGIVSNHKTAEKLIEKVDPRVWPIVEKVVSDHPVLLNRAPTLHRLGIQAFMPKLVEGRAIRLHPLVCTAFNADFDGDQMAVHVPLSEEACAEAKVLMLGSNNILSPKDGQPIVTPSQDMVLGNYYLTLEETKYEFLKEAQTIRERYHDEKQAELWEGFAASEGRVYKDMDEVMMAYDQKQTHLHTRIAIKASSLNKSFFTEEQNSKYLITTVGKLIFNSIFPSDFPYINEVKGDWDRELPNKYFVDKGTDIKAYISSMPIHDAVTKKALGKIIKKVYDKYANHDDNKAGDIEGEVYHGEDQTFVYFDRIKDNGFKFATVAGMTVSLDDIKIAPGKENIVAEGNNNSKKIKDRYKLGQYTTEDWEEMLMEEWSSKKDAAVNRLMDNLPRKNPINMMALSGARGNKEQFGQLGGIRGLMSKPTQDKSAKGYTSKVVEIPITSCFREGQTVFDFFIASHGIRKGLTDTALKTAKSGYLTRRLVDVAQAVLVVEDDCGTTDGYKVSAIGENVPLVIDLQGGDYLGKRLGQDVWADAETMIATKGTILDEDVARSIRMAGISRVVIIDDELTSVRSIEPVGECLVENVIDINGNILATRGTILDEETSRKIIKDGVEIINLNSFKGKNLAEISGQASRKLHDRQLVADVINPLTGEILATKDTAIHDNLVGEMVRSGVSTVVVKAKIYVINELETVVSLVGKTLVADVRDNSAEEAIIARKGDVITEQIANAIIAAGVDTVTVRDEVDVAKNPKIVNKVLVEDVVKGRKVIAAKDTIITNEIAKTIIDSGIRNITVVKKLETSKEIEISRNYPGEAERIDRYIDKTAAKLVGNYLLSDVYDPKTGELIVTRNTDDDNALNIETAYKIISAGVESVMIREDLSLTYNKELVGRTLSEDVVQDGVTLARYNEVLDKKTLRAIYDAGINTVKVQKEPSIIESLEERITGRYAGQEDIINPKTGELIVAQNELITEEKAKEIVGAGITEVYIRNVFICQSRRGVCRKCYGLNMATGKEVENGEAVGIMAAQSIGEPGTQLTMRNFHSGGTAGDDITQGLPRVEALFEARSPKQPAIIAKVDGVITRINERISDRDSSERSVVVQAVGTGEEVVHPIGSQKLEKGVVVGGRVFAGEQLTEGQIAPKELIRCNTSTQTPIEAVQNYILKEVMKVYKSQDIGISDKHLEIMISQMLRNVVVQDPGDSSLTVGSKISKERLLDINSQLLIGEDGMPNFDAKGVKFTQVLSGISKASVETDSWLSAASFQETTKALTDAAVNGKIDVLNGIKENIIIGKKIPAGTGSTAERESTREIKERAERMRAKKLARLEKEKANELTRMQESLDLANFLDEE